MVAKDKRGDADFCHNSSLKFAETINNATSSSSTNSGSTFADSTFPVEVSFARAAVAVPLIEDLDQPGGGEGGNGATSTVISSSFVYLSVLLGAALLATPL